MEFPKTVLIRKTMNNDGGDETRRFRLPPTNMYFDSELEAESAGA